MKMECFLVLEEGSSSPDQVRAACYCSPARLSLEPVSPVQIVTSWWMRFFFKLKLRNGMWIPSALLKCQQDCVLVLLNVKIKLNSHKCFFLHVENDQSQDCSSDTFIANSSLIKCFSGSCLPGWAGVLAVGKNSSICVNLSVTPIKWSNPFSCIYLKKKSHHPNYLHMGWLLCQFSTRKSTSLSLLQQH